jgi:predicted nucleic acid-binding protein
LLVLVDTSVWIEYFQRRDELIEKQLDGLLRSGEVATAGLILAELRRACRTPNQVRLMMDAMEPLFYLESDRTSWVKAGEIAAEASAVLSWKSEIVFLQPRPSARAFRYLLSAAISAAFRD